MNDPAASPRLLTVLLLLLATTRGAEPFSEDFTAFTPGGIPDLFILEGSFTVEEEEGGNHVLQIGPDELVDATVQLGESLRGGGELVARAKGIQQRRSYPRFGIGLHGMSGFQLRVVPARRTVELVRRDEVIQSVPFPWTSGQWHILKLRVESLDNGRWSVTGWVWPEASPPPREALLEYISDEVKLEGKASLTGTPFSGQPIQFDDVRLTPLGDEP